VIEQADVAGDHQTATDPRGERFDHDVGGEEAVTGSMIRHAPKNASGLRGGA
jgi:hypothetical protein